MTTHRVVGSAVAFACVLAIRAQLAGTAGLIVDACLALVAAVSVAKAGRRATAARSVLAWRFQLLNPASWLVGIIILLVGGQSPAWFVARIVALLAAGCAWWLTSRAVDSWSRVRLVVDGGLAAGSTFIVGWDVVFEPIWLSSSGGIEGAVAIGVPLGAVWIAFLGFGLAFTEMRGTHRVMPVLFAAGLLTQAYSDARWAMGDTPLWALGWLLAALATLSYVGTSQRSEIVSTRVSFTYAPYALVAPSAAAYVGHRVTSSIPGPEVAAGLLMLGLLITRQHVTLVENRNLVRRLAVTERMLRHQATHDHLTGLAGRVMLWERLERAEQGGDQDRHLVAVLFIDLDGFKSINDTHGHAAGDYVLVEMARRIEQVAQDHGDDALAVRMSGDEFALFLARGAATNSSAVADRLLELMRKPIELGGVNLSVSASIGVASAPSDSLSPSALLRAADVAMYQIKHGGKGAVAVANGVALTDSLPLVGEQETAGSARSGVAFDEREKQVMEANNPLARLREVPSIVVTSESIGPDGSLPLPHYSGVFGVPGGQDVSPQLSWSGAPDETKSYVVSMYDPDAPTGSGIWHWVVANIPATVTSLAEGVGSPDAPLPEGATTVLNDARLDRYIGAAPPPGDGPHRYFIMVTALNVDHLDFPPDVTPATLALIMSGNVIARGVLVATGEVK